VDTDAASTTAPADQPRIGRRDGRYYALVGAITLLVASLPYLYGWWATPPGHVFTGLTYNADDGAVYLSWMRQAQEGSFFIHNRFAIEPQKDILFNLFFWLLGTAARWTGAGLMPVYQCARVVCGGLLLWAIALLVNDTLGSTRARRVAYALVCVSAGMGWLYRGAIAENGPVDLWQPEAITFLSLYYTPLFTAAAALMVVFLRGALAWEHGGDAARVLWPAGVAGFLLGNFHSYDVIPLFAVWTAYRALSDIAARRVRLRQWAGLIVVGLATLPTTAYTAWVLKTDPVFYQRAFVSTTLSAGIGYVLLGYGVLVPLGLAGVLLPGRTERFRSGDALRLLAVWAVVGIVIAYVPVSFQRKLLMGAHIPWAVLAGAGLAALADRLTGDFPKILIAATVAVTTPSNALFLLRDIGRLQQDAGSTTTQPYLTGDERDALDWLRLHAAHTDPVLIGPDPTAQLRFPNFPLLPNLAVWVPADAGCVAYDGHWSETPEYGRKLALMTRFFQGDTDDEFRRAFLAQTGIRWVLYENALGAGPLRAADGTPFYSAVPWPDSEVPGYLVPTFRNREITIYAVQTPLL
jgi:hypothetical protein